MRTAFRGTLGVMGGITALVLPVSAAWAATTIPATGPFPYVINSPGAYLLGGDVPAPSQPALTTGAIIIAANNVRLDLKGHTITGPGCTGHAGILVKAYRSGISIVGGRVETFEHGIQVEKTVTKLQVHRMTLAENCRDGINATASGLSQHAYSYCTLRDNGDHGIAASVSGSEFTCNRASGNFIGLRVDGSDNVFWANTISRNDDIGLRLAGDRNGLARNRVSENGFNGIFTAVGSRDNIIKWNIAFGNLGPDLHDQNLDFNLTVCVNLWTRNSFAIDNEANGPGVGCIQ